MPSLRGLVVRSQSGFYTVNTETGLWMCRLRGRLKRGPRLGDIVSVGDWVRLTPLEYQTGIIDEIEPRVRALSRLAPDPRGEYHQVILANPDQTVYVFSCSQPEPRFGLLDRFLVISERQGIPALIVANKIDLVGNKKAKSLFGHYPMLGYPVVYTSALTGKGVQELCTRLVGKISVCAGPSGAGKSSLLNAILPGFDLSALRVSRATGKGRHSTVVREMFPLPGGGYVADTPGLKALALWDIAAEELDGYFPELRPLVSQCQFNNCTHSQEPGCAVRAAVEQGRVHPQRYRSYLRMRFGEEE